MIGYLRHSLALTNFLHFARRLRKGTPTPGSNRQDPKNDQETHKKQKSPF